jgi:16S rRNA (guanine966-N2)-methyltransferase
MSSADRVRIIGGMWRGRQITVPATGQVRPTGDRVREAWFNIMQYDIPAATVLDLCAGSGALGIEALSRGASHVTFVDDAPAALAMIRSNLNALHAKPETFTALGGDALSMVRTLPARAFDVAVADPPYALDIAAALVAAWHAVPFATLLAVEHPASLNLAGGGDSRRYGQTAITFFRG